MTKCRALFQDKILSATNYRTELMTLLWIWRESWIGWKEQWLCEPCLTGVFLFVFYLSHMYPNVSDTPSPCRHLHTALQCRCWAHQRLCTHKVQFPENSTWKFSPPKADHMPHPQTNPQTTQLWLEQVCVTTSLTLCIGFDSKVQKHVWGRFSHTCNATNLTNCTFRHWFCVSAWSWIKAISNFIHKNRISRLFCFPLAVDSTTLNLNN